MGLEPGTLQPLDSNRAIKLDGNHREGQVTQMVKNVLYIRSYLLTKDISAMKLQIFEQNDLMKFIYRRYYYQGETFA